MHNSIQVKTMPGTKEKPVENVYDKVATTLHSEYDRKGFHSIEKRDFKDYVSYFKIRSVDGFRKSLGIDKSERGFSKMKMMETLRQARLREKSGQAAREVSNKGILPYAREAARSAGNFNLIKPMPVKSAPESYAERQKRKDAGAEKRAETREKVKQEVMKTGIFAEINRSGAQNVVLMKAKLTPEQQDTLKQLHRENMAVSETKSKKKSN
jgi:hypothetical protein